MYLYKLSVKYTLVGFFDLEIYETIQNEVLIYNILNYEM